jgi:hypothetical protein
MFGNIEPLPSKEEQKSNNKSNMFVLLNPVLGTGFFCSVIMMKNSIWYFYFDFLKYINTIFTLI